MTDNVESNADRLVLTKRQVSYLNLIRDSLEKKLKLVFEKKMSCIITINDPDLDKHIGYVFSNVDKNKVFQTYVDNFCALKKNMSKEDRVNFMIKFLSDMFQDDDEKKECFKWLLLELRNKMDKKD